MHDRDSAEQTGRGLTDQILIWGGVLLLLAGGLLAYPYVSSRLVAPPTTPTSTPRNQVFSEKPGFSSPIVTSVALTSTPTTTFPHAPTPTLPHTPTPAPPTHIVIPAIGVDAPVVLVSWHTVEVNGQTQAAWEVPAMYAAGWHENSATLGVVGNTVLSGHNTTNGEVFRDLYMLETGDTITIYSDDTLYTYAVTEVLILPEAGQPMEVRIENARYILPTDDERLTLVTCHPYSSLQYRLIVIAHPSGE